MAAAANFRRHNGKTSYRREILIYGLCYWLCSNTVFCLRRLTGAIMFEGLKKFFVANQLYLYVALAGFVVGALVL